jgi:hypothetical protein
MDVATVIIMVMTPALRRIHWQFIRPLVQRSVALDQAMFFQVTFPAISAQPL